MRFSPFPTRKPHRLDDYDYSTPGAYFVTICTKERRPVLSHIAVGTTIGRPPEVQLSTLGHVVEDAILQIPVRYEGTVLDQYVVMPNHVHLLLQITSPGGPKLGQIIQQLKGHVTKQWGKPVWQEKFYDHVIRDESDFLIKYQYISNNPAKLAEDEYFSES